MPPQLIGFKFRMVRVFRHWAVAAAQCRPQVPTQMPCPLDLRMEFLV